MSEVEFGFRTALVGGFQREDVIEYITNKANENNALKEQMEKEKAELYKQIEIEKDRAKNLINENTNLANKNEKLMESMSQLQKSERIMKKELSEKKSILEHTQNSNEKQEVLYNEVLETAKNLKRRYRELELENQELLKKVDVLEQKASEFEKDRTYIADIELNAHKRAEEIEKKAKQKAEFIIMSAEREAENIKNEIEKAKLEYIQTLKNAIFGIDDIKKRAEEVMSKLKGNNIKTEIPKNDKNTALTGMLNSIRKEKG